MDNQTILISNLLERIGIKSLNEMQHATIDAHQNHPNIVLKAPTGSGKTFSYLIPAINGLKPEIKQVQCLIISPSRELAIQIDSVARKFASGFKITCCYGGHKREIEENNLIEAPALIIGTPGRIGDHIRRGNFQTSHITQLVIDEYDKCLELGFAEEMDFAIKSLTGLQRTTLISATGDFNIPSFLSDPFYLDFSSFKQIKNEADELAEYQFMSPEKDKADSLFEILCAVDNKPTIVFFNHRDAAERIYQMLKDKGLVPVFYHGGMQQADREMSIIKFKNGTSNILLTTDLASRGLDMSTIRYIVHYHLPASLDALTHRNGRTARMFAGGRVVYLLSGEEKLPEFVQSKPEMFEIPEDNPIPEKPKWSTLFFDAGKKDKLNKIDIVGFLHQIGGVKKEDLGLIEVNDFNSFAAVRKLKVGPVMEKIKEQKIKNRKIKIAIAK